MQDYEKLGVFYLGREFDLGAKKLKDELVLYDSRDLVTHAVVVGMTGSGKTGLCIDLIEEAAIDNVPSLLIDPKGDLTNLLLTFPQLRGEDFQPWINPDDATRKGLTPENFAIQQSELWKKGLADWGEDGARIQRLRDAAEFVIYTPGSNAGIPISILKSFAAPSAEIIEDGELFKERITTTVTSLLGLLKIEADPLQSREHILLSTIIGQTWRQGQDLDLATLIGQVQKPPINKIGVLDLESFYPSKDRFELVMALNNLLASPDFSTWLEGNPLDIDAMLHSSKGKPRVAIFSVAHLGDAERMFFVSLLLNQFIGWMRNQAGTTSLRTILYMDEIFGYFPPIANPPSKQPLLTLLKQARAYGIGVVLATQNPADLDYKGLANTGTWFIGRLQTERDKMRVLEGLEGAVTTAGSNFDRSNMDKILSGLGSRVFLMNNTHEDQPTVFQTRWSLSYLRGPMTRSQIKQLMDVDRAKFSAAALQTAQSIGSSGTAFSTQATSSESTTPRNQPPAAARTTGLQPSLPADISQYFIPLRGNPNGVEYRPMLIGGAKVRFTDTKAGIDVSSEMVSLTSIEDRPVPVDWSESVEANIDLNDLEKNPAAGVTFADLPGAASNAKNYTAWSRDFANWLFSEQKQELLRSPSTGVLSKPNESERDFRLRLSQASREQRDEAVDALRKKYAPKIATLQEKVRRAQQAVDREQAQAKQAGFQTAISVGATLLGAFMGRKVTSSSNLSHAATSIRQAGRTMEQSGDIGRAKETMQTYQKQLDDLNAQFTEESNDLQSKIDPMAEDLENVVVRPKKTDINVQMVALTWAPYRNSSPAW